MELDKSPHELFSSLATEYATKVVYGRGVSSVAVQHKMQINTVLRIYIYTYIHVYIYTYTHTYVYTFIHIYIYTCI